LAQRTGPVFQGFPAFFGDRDHCLWVNYRTNVYSTMCDTPKKAGNPWKTGPACTGPGGSTTAASGVTGN